VALFAGGPLGMLLRRDADARGSCGELRLILPATRAALSLAVFGVSLAVLVDCCLLASRRTRLKGAPGPKPFCFLPDEGVLKSPLPFLFEARARAEPLEERCPRNGALRECAVMESPMPTLLSPRDPDAAPACRLMFVSTCCVSCKLLCSLSSWPLLDDDAAALSTTRPVPETKLAGRPLPACTRVVSKLPGSFRVPSRIIFSTTCMHEVRLRKSAMCWYDQSGGGGMSACKRT
jgi:hypothetical protein